MVKMDEYNKLLNEEKASAIATVEKSEEDIIVRAQFTNDILAVQSFAELQDATGAYIALCYNRAFPNE